jgi:hypothetical protein
LKESLRKKTKQVDTSEVDDPPCQLKVTQLQGMLEEALANLINERNKKISQDKHCAK